MKSPASFLLRVVGGFVALGVVGFGMLVWQFDRPPFDLTKLQQLERGMTQQQVRQMLGEPRSTTGRTWSYSRPMVWPVVHVRFDASGKLERHEYDH